MPKSNLEQTHHILPQYTGTGKFVPRNGVRKYYRAAAERHNRAPHRRVFIGPRFRKASQADEYGKKWEQLAHAIITKKFLSEDTLEQV